MTDDSHQIEHTEERPDGSTWGKDPRNGRWIQVWPPGTYFNHVQPLSAHILGFFIVGDANQELENRGDSLRNQLRSSPHRELIESRVLKGISNLVSKGKMSADKASEAQAWIQEK